jgi:hypothetical protein
MKYNHSQIFETNKDGVIVAKVPVRIEQMSLAIGAGIGNMVIEGPTIGQFKVPESNGHDLEAEIVDDIYIIKKVY